MGSTDARQNVRLTNAEDLARLQGNKLATLDAASAQHAAKFRVSDASIVQQTVRQAALDRRGDRTAERQTESGRNEFGTRLSALEATSGRHAAQLAVSDATIVHHTVRLAVLEAAVGRQEPVRLLFDNVKRACSQICFRPSGVSYIGSGWFYYDSVDDLAHGYFVTAAHCVMTV